MEQRAKAVFEVLYMEEARAFIKSLPQKVQEKIAYNITKSRYFTDKALFKKLDGTDIWEFRTLYGGNCYRLFAFWDTQQNALVVATHGLQKKSQKPPLKEIEKAEATRKSYFEEKRNNSFQ